MRAGRRRSEAQRATLTGPARGLIFGISDALTRRARQIVDSHGMLAVATTGGSES